MANLPTLMGQRRACDRHRDAHRSSAACCTQEPDRVTEARESWPPTPIPDPDSRLPDVGIRVVTKRQPTAEEWTALRFAWRVCAHVKSNTIVFTGADRTLAVGAGQMSRVDAVKVAVMKARRDSGAAAEGQRRRVRRVLPVPRRPRRRRRRGRDGGRAAWRLGQGCRGDCRRRRARPGRWSSRGAAISATSASPASFRRQADLLSALLALGVACISSRSATPPSGTPTRRSTSRRRARCSRRTTSSTRRSTTCRASTSRS